jgi:hypothetical protein
VTANGSLPATFAAPPLSDQPASEPSKLPPGTAWYELESPHAANGLLTLVEGHAPLLMRAALAAPVPATAEAISTPTVHASPKITLMGVG